MKQCRAGSCRAFAGSALAVALVLVVAAVAAGGVAPVSAQPPGQLCTWEEVGQQATLATHHLAGTIDTRADRALFFGGADQTRAAPSYLADMDLSDVSLDNAVGPTRLNIQGVQPRYGSQCFYRPAPGSPTGGEVYCIGGASDPGTGAGTSTVQRLDTTSGNWVANINPVGTFGPRLHFAAAFDPASDLAVFHGGTRTCALKGDSPLTEPPGCTADVFSTTLLRFDATGQAARWEQLGGSDVIGRVFLHSMVFDPLQRRMITFGGTNNGTRPRGDVHVLDLSAPASSPAWAPLVTAGVAPARYAHAAAFHSARNWMVVYGGVAGGFQTAGESTTDTSWALDLSTAPPAWVNLGATVGALVGATMVYDENHGTVILFGGRTRYKQGPLSINRKSYALRCDAAPPTPVPAPTATPSAMYEICPGIRNRVPNAVLSSAVANPGSIENFGQLCNPSLPPSIWNVERRLLALLNPGTPYHPLYNSVQWKCVCQ